jgi:adenylylsulfate kinase-like enzyme
MTLVDIIRKELAEPYGFSDNLRTAAMYSLADMSATMSEFVAAAKVLGVNAGTARNRYNETRNWMRELGEI